MQSPTFYLVAITYGFKQLVVKHWPILVFSATIIAAMAYVSLKHSPEYTVAVPSIETPAVPQPDTSHYSLDLVIQSECEKIAVSPGVIYKMVDFGKKLSGDVGSGITLIKLATAREAMHDNTITAKQLIEDTTLNVTAAIRYLGQMKARFGNNIHLAVLAYYRGPTKVDNELAAGTNPSSGIEMKVLGSRLTFPI